MNTKVWTYVIGSPLSDEDLAGLGAEGKKFVSNWTAHEQQLEASFEIVGGRIIVVKVNEDVNDASGCSIDKLTRFIKETGSKFGFDPLNRFLVALKREHEIEVVHASQIKELLRQNVLSADTMVFNTSVANEADFAEWEQPLGQTWLKKYL